MFWCHGGGFDSGTSAWNPGMGLAKKDVVVVSINHRLNIIGFLDLSATGDPNVEGLPEWHPYTQQNGECYMFGPEIEVRNNFDRELQEIINRHCFQKLDAFRATGSLK